MKKFFLLIIICLAPLLNADAPQIYFSPSDHVADHLITLIEKETKSLQIAVYCFTHRGIADALIDAKVRGVEVEILTDPYTIKAKGPLDKIVDAGIPVYIWVSPGKSMRKPIMHHKFCVFGCGLVWTGSFNF